MVKDGNVKKFDIVHDNYHIDIILIMSTLYKRPIGEQNIIKSICITNNNIIVKYSKYRCRKPLILITNKSDIKTIRIEADIYNNDKKYCTLYFRGPNFYASYVIMDHNYDNIYNTIIKIFNNNYWTENITSDFNNLIPIY